MAHPPSPSGPAERPASNAAPEPGREAKSARRRSLYIVAAICLCAGLASLVINGWDATVAVVFEDAGLILSIMPKLAASLLIAGAVIAMLPREMVARWLARSSGMRGFGLAQLGGMLIPGGPLTIFPVALSLLRSGADVGLVVTFVTSWLFLGFNRILVWEVPILGAEFAFARYLIGLPLPIIAGLVARLILHAVGPRLEEALRR